MSDVRIALAVSARDWADGLHRFTTDHGGALIRVRVMSERDAVEQDYDVLIADDVASFLSTRLVSVLRSQNKAIIGVCEGSERVSATEFLAAMGVHDVVSSDLDPEAFLDLANNLATSQPERREVVDIAPQSEARFGLTAVIGCSGGVGSTEVAIGLAQTLPDERILIDLDVQYPAVAQRLGLNPQPNLRSALDAHRHSPAKLSEQMIEVSRGLEVLAGVVSADDWGGMRPAEVLQLVEGLLADRAIVVNLPALASSSDRPTRRLTKMVLELADDVVVVTVPTPVGVTRLIEWAASWAEAPESRVHVVFNRSPRSLFKRGESFEEAIRALDPSSVVFLPEDLAITKAAWQGTLVRSRRFLGGLSRIDLRGTVA
jgi:MinD-like ATPase involved in chromosome partitioning or flagellar assembly